MSNDTIKKSDDIIDSRDVIKRIETLDGDLRESHEAECGDEAGSEFEAWLISQAEDIDGPFNDEATELLALLEMQKEGENYASDWRDGVTLIRDGHFEKYTKEFAEDVGAIPSDVQWPCNCIDWEQAAKELQQDYTGIDFDGETYWIR